MTDGIGKLLDWLGGWPRWAAIGAEDFDGAAREMLASKWAVQVGVRSSRLARRMREG